MNDMAKLIMTFEGKKLDIKHQEGPQGVRGRNSDNTLIKKVLGWAPATPLEDGLRSTYNWIKQMIEKDVAAGIDIATYKGSSVVTISSERTVENH